MQTTYNATFTSKGQLTFPSAIRKLHGIKAGHTAKFIKHNKKTGEITIKIENELDLVNRLAGSLHSNIPFKPLDEIREQVHYEIGKYRANQMKKIEKEQAQKKK